MERSAFTNHGLRRLIAVQVVIAVSAVAVTLIAGRQMSDLIQARRDLSRQVILLRSQKTAQESIIKKLQSERAKAEAERATVLQQLIKSRSAAEHVRSGINHYQRGEYAAAIDAYNAALAITPDNPAIYDWLAYAQFKAHNYAEALDNEQHALQLDPSYARGYYNLALVLWRTGKREDAMSALRHMAELDPQMVNEVRKDGQFAPFLAVPEFRHFIGSPAW